MSRKLSAPSLAPMTLVRSLALSVLVAFTTLVACGDDSSAPQTPADAGAPDAGAAGSEAGATGAEAGAASLGFFEAFEHAQALVRQSPDHLPAMAEALVKTKDAQKMFEFVRDQILTYPPSSDGFGDCVSAQRWGIRGTLRGGAGTPREKAELLVMLYTQAGLQAEVLRGTADPKLLDGKKVLLRTIERTFAPPALPGEASEIREALGNEPPAKRSLIDAKGAQAKALADSLLAVLDPNAAATPFDFTLTDFPLVRVKVGGKFQFANVIAPDAAFGDSLTSDEPVGAVEPDAAPGVLVRLEGARADKPFQRFTLVENTFDAEDVVGRRINLNFAPPIATQVLVRTLPRNITTFVPILSVAGSDLTQKDRDRLGVAGKPVTIGGDVYDRDADGNVTINDSVLPDADPKAAAKVATVAAAADPAAFPEVRLRVGAVDKSGTAVTHLAADAITVTENGQPVSFTITQNEAPSPRVVLLFDASTSVPAEFRGDGAVMVGNQIVDSLYAKYPNAQVRVGVINFGASWADGGWATGKDAALAEVASLATAAGSSEIWQALKEAADEAPTLIVLVSDGDATDQDSPEFRNAIASGPPVLSIGVGTVVGATFDEVSTLSGGATVPVTMQGEAVSAVLDAVDQRATEDYTIHYEAPTAGESPREVTVTINGKSVTTSYDVPESPTTPRALSGLYLTIRANGQEVTRAIAGFSRGFSTAPQAISSSALADVRAMLLGRLSIAVEGAAPTAAVVLDDWISDKLTLRPIWDAAQAHDQDAVYKALEQGFTVTPVALPLSQPPLPNAAAEDALTFETGLRVATFSIKAFDGGPVTHELDLFPLSQWATAADDPRVAYERTLRATAALAVNEAALLSKTSTLASLTGKPLIAIKSNEAADQAGLTDDEQSRWAVAQAAFAGKYTFLTPGKPGAFWAVDDATGTLIGLLPDGAGGSGGDACGTYNAANTFLNLAGLAGSAMGISIGGWVALAEWEVKYVTIADIVIGGGDLPPGDDPSSPDFDVSNPAADMGCGMVDDALGNVIPGLGYYENLLAGLDLLGADTGNAPSVCGGGDDGLCQ